MEIARISVQQTTLDLEQKSPATKGMVGAAVVFEHFGPEWDGLSKTAVFRSSTVSRDVTNVQEGEPVVIPWEVLEDVLTDLQVGICGHNRSGNLVIPTLWASLGKISPGAAPVGRPSEPPTPDWSAQLEAQVNQALTEARAVGPLTQQAADAATAANDAAASADMAAERALQAARDTNGFTETARKAVTLTVDNAKAALDAQNAAAESAAHANSSAGIASGAADRAAASEQAADTAAQNALTQGKRAETEARRAKEAADRVSDMAQVGTSLGVQGAIVGDFFQVKAVDSRGRVTEWEPQKIQLIPIEQNSYPDFEIVEKAYTSVQKLGKLVYVYVSFRIKTPDNSAWKTLLQGLPAPYNKTEMVMPVLTRTGKGPCRVKLQDIGGSWNLVVAGGEASVDFMDRVYFIDIYDVAYAYLME